MRRKKILVVDDRRNTLKVIAAILEDEGYAVRPAASAQEALALYDHETDIDAVLSDLKMPGMDGLALYREICAHGNPPPFVIMTAYGTVKSAVAALKEGVSNYLIKPLDYEEMSIVLSNVIRTREMADELTNLKQESGRPGHFHHIIGANAKMKEIFNLVRTVGATDVSVMIYGETGTGKELLARALHQESGRREREMVCINSAALSESLLEAELFGYVKGAFTGAGGDRPGRLEMADGGTLFLDEIGQMSLRLQAKLLRFLQEMTFEPVGGAKQRRVDVRVIAATNFDLQKEIRAGRFMKDLLYRIEVIPIHMPALRQRKDDIYLLVDHFVRQYARQYHKEIERVSSEAMACLVAYPWPGNVRELKNILARAVILSKNSTLSLDDLPQKISDGQPRTDNASGQGLIRSLPHNGLKLQAMENELIRKTLAVCNGNKSLAAQFLGISRKTLYQKMKRYQIEG